METLAIIDFLHSFEDFGFATQVEILGLLFVLRKFMISSSNIMNCVLAIMGN